MFCSCRYKYIPPTTIILYIYHSVTLYINILGCVSALIYGPVDLMVIQQQKFVASLSDTFNIIRQKYGAMRIYRGVVSCMVRESIYTMGYLGVAPVVQNRLKIVIHGLWIIH